MEFWGHRREAKAGNALEAYPGRVIAPRDSQIQETLFDGAITDAIDPFASLSISKSRHANTLLHHCMQFCCAFDQVTTQMDSHERHFLYTDTLDSHLHSAIAPAGTPANYRSNKDDSVFIHSNMAVNPKTKWLGYAITDPALLHATLIHSALHISLLTNTAPPSDVFLHNGMAIRSINQRLGNTIISDTMIAAISCLAHMEVS